MPLYNKVGINLTEERIRSTKICNQAAKFSLNVTSLHTKIVWHSYKLNHTTFKKNNSPSLIQPMDYQSVFSSTASIF